MDKKYNDNQIINYILYQGYIFFHTLRILYFHYIIYYQLIYNDIKIIIVI